MKKQYQYILWDVDDTLVDFKVSEKLALQACFATCGVSLTEAQIATYSHINHDYWKMLEQGKIEKKVMLEQRFADFAKHLSLESLDCKAINTMFQTVIGDYAVMMPHAHAVCTQLKATKHQYAITNGTPIAQNKKLRTTGLWDLLAGAFISDAVGYEKPDQRFFAYVCNNIPDFDPAHALVVGDSLTSDMLGANQAGLDCCWYNPHGAVNANDAIAITYEIKDLQELLDIVG